LNGVPSLSILDGWWVEGHIEGVTGWAIGNLRRGAAEDAASDDRGEAQSLYEKLEVAILPTFYNERRKFIEIMQHAIAVNGAYFNTQRMVQDYIANAYIR
ncbi:MAG: alpha-glucan family phosphorylase, partial [Candidatus Acidiferrum sp.]